MGGPTHFGKASCLLASPQSLSLKNELIQKWCVVEDDVIAIKIYPAWPVQDDDEPYGELFVPENWEKRQRFIGDLKPPSGFENVSQYSDGELDATSCVFKYVRYESYAGSDGRFDATSLIEAFREATKTLVAMEKDVDQILERLG